MSLGRTDLALEIARKERRRLDLFVPGSAEGQKRLLRHVIACITLSGGLSAEKARIASDEEAAALGLTYAGGTGDLAAQLHAATPGRDSGVAAVRPDIVGEALVVETFLRDGLSSRQQGEAVRRCAKRRPGAVAATLFRACQDFAADEKRVEAVVRWTEAVIELGTDGDLTILLAIESALPRQSTLLREAAVRITRSLYAQMRNMPLEGPAADTARLARLANNLGIRLNDVGRRSEALGPAEEAVALYRALAEHNPDAFRHDLASVLNNLSNRLSAVGRRSEALEPAEEAVALYRALAAQNPDAFRPGLASVLNNLANRLKAVGRLSEALGAAEEAVALRRALAAQNPDAFRSALASALNNLAIGLSDVGRRSEALGPAEEAVALRRALTAQNPDAFRPDLARVADQLGERAGRSGAA